MTQTPRIDVVGGAYEEWCLRPAWHEVFGSAGRAASAIAAMAGPSKVTLHCYADARTAQVLEARCALEGTRLVAVAVPATCSFRYTHALQRPEVEVPQSTYASVVVRAETVLRFGMLEGDAVVHGKRVVYDPQGRLTPEPFGANGSSADELFIVLNEREALAITGLAEGATALKLAEATRALHKATGVIVKRGPLGALVLDGDDWTEVPAFETETVWKIGSGDVFAAHFALNWAAHGHSATDSAYRASLATAVYCDGRGFPEQSTLDVFPAMPIRASARWMAGRQPRIYLASPIFTLGQLWLVEQVRENLRMFGLEVFSPFHDVGYGSADDVVQLDLEGIHNSDLVYAVADGMDSGTIYEVGYARAQGKPVVVYCENESSEDLKMLEGSSCVLCKDYVSSIYRALWTAMAL
ncbi:PfkB family carbohydrate kinase [Hydrogenophaga sp. ANAO-22]|uniref:PfkB family carbohydrate kinase n=1 Tax=Hydrogenophaga sp. ANAO-22 TaxID=3166645 RepID=UPI0036D21509